MDNIEYYLDIGHSVINFTNKNILEVGGCVPPNLLGKFKPKSWTSIDITENIFNKLEDLIIPNFYKHYVMNICETKFEDNSFDCIYSTNCFEHILGLEKALKEMYRILKPKGVLFTIFGPIWSSPQGHHTWIHDGDNIIKFSDNIFPNWSHLAYTPDELSTYLSKKYRPEVIKKIIDYVYYSDDLNRFTDSDYRRILKDSEFQEILIYGKKKGKDLTTQIESRIKTRYPNIVNLRTSEYLMILSKGKVSLCEEIKIYKGLAYQYFKKYF